MPAYRPRRVGVQNFYGGAAKALIAAHNAAQKWNKAIGYGTSSNKRKAIAMATKPTKSYSKTKRRRGTAKYTQSQQHNHAGRSGHYLFFSPRKYSPKVLKFCTGLQKYVQETQTYAVCEATKCAYTTDSIMDMNELKKIWNAQSKLTANVVTGNAGETSVTGNDSTTAQRNYKLWLGAGSAEYRIKNNGNHPVELIIYCYKTKRDSTITPGTAMLSDSSVLNSGGLGQQILSASDTISYETVGMYPSDSQQFKLYWKVMEQEKKTLMPGETHVYRLHTRWNKVAMSGLRLATGTSTLLDPFYMKGYSGGVMFRISGYPVHGTANDNNIGLSKGRIDVVGIKRYSFRAMHSARENVNYFGAQYLLTDPEYMDVATGQMERTNIGGVVSTSTDEV